jgi:DNA-binding response OmpR family regulator
MANTRVVLIEDDLFWGDILAGALTRRGYEVAWFVRAELVGADGVKLMDPDGKTAMLNADEHDIALVDGRLSFSNLYGWHLTPRIVAAGLPVIAISGADGYNEQMLEAGARQKFAKHDLFMALARKDFVLSR